LLRRAGDGPRLLPQPFAPQGVQALSRAPALLRADAGLLARLRGGGDIFRRRGIATSWLRPSRGVFAGADRWDEPGGLSPRGSQTRGRSAHWARAVAGSAGELGGGPRSGGDGTSAGTITMNDPPIVRVHAREVLDS